MRSRHSPCVALGAAGLMVLVSALPAFAGNWGENWGEMTWGELIAAVPLTGRLGFFALVFGLLCVVLWTFRKRAGTGALLLFWIGSSPYLADAQVTVPNTFTDGTPALASEVNENFETLAAALSFPDCATVDDVVCNPVLSCPTCPTCPAIPACDTLGSYGTLAKYKDLRRMAEVNEKCLIGAGGEYSDFQYIQSLLDELRTDDANLADGFTLSPAEIFSYLRVVLYNRRSKFNPLWNNLVVAGFTGGKPFLGTVDLIGTAFEDDLIATGFGAHLALPLMRKALDETPAHLMEEGVARALLEDCLRVLFYRDCRALNRVQVRARPPRR